MNSRSPGTSRPSTRSPKLLLLDIDGTMLRSHGGALKAMTRAARRLFGPTFSLEEVDRNGQLDPKIIGMALDLNGVRATPREIDAFRDFYIEELQAELGSTRILPGVLDLLTRLRATEGVLLGLVTGNYAGVARIKLPAVGIDPSWFVANGFGDEGATRGELVRRAMDTAASLAGRPITGGDVIVVGDTPRDVECAKANGCACLAVATGNFTRQVLEAAGADAVIPDLTNPAPLWAMLEDPD